MSELSHNIAKSRRQAVGNKLVDLTTQINCYMIFMRGCVEIMSNKIESQIPNTHAWIIETGYQRIQTG